MRGRRPDSLAVFAAQDDKLLGAFEEVEIVGNDETRGLQARAADDIEAVISRGRGPPAVIVFPATEMTPPREPLPLNAATGNVIDPFPPPHLPPVVAIQR